METADDAVDVCDVRGLKNDLDIGGNELGTGTMCDDDVLRNQALGSREGGTDGTSDELPENTAGGEDPYRFPDDASDQDGPVRTGRSRSSKVRRKRANGIESLRRTPGYNWISRRLVRRTRRR